MEVWYRITFSFKFGCRGIPFFSFFLFCYMSQLFIECVVGCAYSYVGRFSILTTSYKSEHIKFKPKNVFGSIVTHIHMKYCGSRASFRKVPCSPINQPNKQISITYYLFYSCSSFSRPDSILFITPNFGVSRQSLGNPRNKRSEWNRRRWGWRIVGRKECRVWRNAWRRRRCCWYKRVVRSWIEKWCLIWRGS